MQVIVIFCLYKNKKASAASQHPIQITLLCYLHLLVCRLRTCLQGVLKTIILLSLAFYVNISRDTLIGSDRELDWKLERRYREMLSMLRLTRIDLN